MAFGFYFPSKSAYENTDPGSVAWNPSHGPAFPLGTPRDYPNQVVLRAGDGEIHVQEQGDLNRGFSLKFKHLPELDVLSYQTFFETVKKTYEAFEYEDGKGGLQTVRIMNAFDFKKTGVVSYSGSINLEVE